MIRLALLFLASLSGRQVLSAQAAELTLRAGALELEARWEPLTDTVYGFEKQHPELGSPAPCVVRERHGAEAFRAFLPSGPVAVGDTWRVEAAAALPFLRQLHAGATASLHHGEAMGLGIPGAWACLRSLDEQEAEIVLRVHAEFRQAGPDGETRLWITPAQFRGRLRLDRTRGEVRAFELLLPDQSANVDVNVAVEGDVLADIGRFPSLGVAGGEFSGSEAGGGLSLAAAEALLARRFYPLAELEWLELPEALARARETDQPLHIVALFGSLLDESC